jgi:hypothetical protein
MFTKLPYIEGTPHFSDDSQVGYLADWWFGTFLFFHSVGNVIIPTDFNSMIFRGVGQP